VPISSGDVFHVVDLGSQEALQRTQEQPRSVFAELATAGKITVSNARGLLVVHPDVLVSPTKIAESRSCMRRAVLTDRIRSFGDISAPAVMGNLKHAFIEVRNALFSLTCNSWGERGHCRGCEICWSPEDFSDPCASLYVGSFGNCPRDLK
jgi:hypothetical protein